LKRVIVSFRVLFVIAAILAAIAGIQLYILSDYTDHYFAWTIKPPLSAAFLGAIFWSGTCLVLFAARETIWANIRVAIAALSFAFLILIATLLHLDRLHFHSNDSTALVAAWAWVIVYVAVPVAIAVVFFLQLLAPGAEPPLEVQPRLWIRLLIGINALISGTIGVLLFFFPGVIGPFWPWDLTPFMSKVVGSSFLAIFAASVQFLLENDWNRGRVGTVAYALVGLL
jgi:hypothetical protein